MAVEKWLIKVVISAKQTAKIKPEHDRKAAEVTSDKHRLVLDNEILDHLV